MKHELFDVLNKAFELKESINVFNTNDWIYRRLQYEDGSVEFWFDSGGIAMFMHNLESFHFYRFGTKEDAIKMKKHYINSLPKPDLKARLKKYSN